MKTPSKQIDVYQIVTDLIIEKLEGGIIPWQKPWSDYGPAVNYVPERRIAASTSVSRAGYTQGQSPSRSNKPTTWAAA